MDLLNKKSLLPLESEALKGREEEIEIPTEHFPCQKGKKNY